VAATEPRTEPATVTLTTLTDYEDDRGNVVAFPGSTSDGVQIHFTGGNNRLVVDGEAYLSGLVVHFNCDNGYVEVGPSTAPALNVTMRVGQDSRILIGRNVSSTGRVGMSAVEGTTITVGDDVMFASENQVRTDDGHPIFDVVSGRRVNPSLDVTIGNHVWVGWGGVLLGGTTIGDGSVVGMRALVKGRFPNNCVVAGVPATMIRRDVAWERPHLSLAEPYYKPDSSTVRKSRYWHATVDPAHPLRLRSRLHLAVRRARHRLRRR
jgi:acetyltransferase-like isoleucine patch superfamily enzyme